MSQSGNFSAADERILFERVWPGFIKVKEGRVAIVSVKWIIQWCQYTGIDILSFPLYDASAKDQIERIKAENEQMNGVGNMTKPNVLDNSPLQKDEDDVMNIAPGLEEGKDYICLPLPAYCILVALYNQPSSSSSTSSSPRRRLCSGPHYVRWLKKSGVLKPTYMPLLYPQFVRVLPCDPSTGRAVRDYIVSGVYRKQRDWNNPVYNSLVTHVSTQIATTIGHHQGETHVDTMADIPNLTTGECALQLRGPVVIMCGAVPVDISEQINNPGASTSLSSSSSNASEGKTAPSSIYTGEGLLGLSATSKLGDVVAAALRLWSLGLANAGGGDPFKSVGDSSSSTVIAGTSSVTNGEETMSEAQSIDVKHGDGEMPVTPSGNVFSERYHRLTSQVDHPDELVGWMHLNLLPSLVISTNTSESSSSSSSLPSSSPNTTTTNDYSLIIPSLSLVNESGSADVFTNTGLVKYAHPICALAISSMLDWTSMKMYMAEVDEDGLNAKATKEKEKVKEQDPLDFGASFDDSPPPPPPSSSDTSPVTHASNTTTPPPVPPVDGSAGEDWEWRELASTEREKQVEVVGKALLQSSRTRNKLSHSALVNEERSTTSCTCVLLEEMSSPLTKVKTDSPTDDVKLNWPRTVFDKAEETLVLSPGTLVDAKDRVGKWYKSKIVSYDSSRDVYRVHFLDWGESNNEDLPKEKIAPYDTITKGKKNKEGVDGDGAAKGPFRSEGSMGANRYGYGGFYGGGFGGWGATRENTRGRTFPGVAGLVNLGNTCYMNSILQCLSNTAPLTALMLDTPRMQRAINKESPLGKGGELAEAYAKWLEDMWSGEFTVVNPHPLRKVLARGHVAFEGYGQQDSSELLGHLIDSLHEDMNARTKKPLTQPVECRGRPDFEVAAEAWEVHEKRNKSVVMDMCWGQSKSTKVCLDCGTPSVTFDPFHTLIVPVPVFNHHAQASAHSGSAASQGLTYGIDDFSSLDPNKSESLTVTFVRVDPTLKVYTLDLLVSASATIGDVLKEVAACDFNPPVNPKCLIFVSPTNIVPVAPEFRYDRDKYGASTVYEMVSNELVDVTKDKFISVPIRVSPLGRNAIDLYIALPATYPRDLLKVMYRGEDFVPATDSAASGSDANHLSKINYPSIPKPVEGVPTEGTSREILLNRLKRKEDEDNDSDADVDSLDDMELIQGNGGLKERNLNDYQPPPPPPPPPKPETPGLEPQATAPPSYHVAVSQPTRASVEEEDRGVSDDDDKGQSAFGPVKAADIDVDALAGSFTSSNIGTTSSYDYANYNSHNSGGNTSGSSSSSSSSSSDFYSNYNDLWNMDGSRHSRYDFRSSSSSSSSGTRLDPFSTSFSGGHGLHGASHSTGMGGFTSSASLLRKSYDGQLPNKAIHDLVCKFLQRILIPLDAEQQKQSVSEMESINNSFYLLLKENSGKYSVDSVQHHLISGNQPTDGEDESEGGSGSGSADDHEVTDKMDDAVAPTKTKAGDVLLRYGQPFLGTSTYVEATWVRAGGRRIDLKLFEPEAMAENESEIEAKGIAEGKDSNSNSNSNSNTTALTSTPLDGQEEKQDTEVSLPESDEDGYISPEVPYYSSLPRSSDIEATYGFYRRNILSSNKRIDLDECMKAFAVDEQLDSDNMARCSNCKKLTPTKKKLEVFRLPDVLMVVLRRFSTEDGVNYSKINNPVDYPIYALDMVRYMSPSVRDALLRIRNQAREEVGENATEAEYNTAFERLANEETALHGYPLKDNYLYDLIGVSLHRGTMMGGHYTAYARNFLSGQWHIFDDEHTRRVSVDDVQSNAAYVLFYQRRGCMAPFEAELPPLAPFVNPNTAGNSAPAITNTTNAPLTDGSSGRAAAAAASSSSFSLSSHQFDPVVERRDDIYSAYNDHML